MILGIDPDLTSTALAVLNPHHDEIARFGLIRAARYEDMLESVPLELRRLLGPHADNIDVAVVEGQQIYQSRIEGKEARADKNDLIRLAHVTGTCVGVLRSLGIDAVVVLPVDWKGQRSKLATGEKLVRKWDWEAHRRGGKDPYLEMVGRESMVKTSDGRKCKVSDWKHLVDAAGIAVWATEPKGVRMIQAATSAARVR